jgi:hypothetical protein
MPQRRQSIQFTKRDSELRPTKVKEVQALIGIPILKCRHLRR